MPGPMPSRDASLARPRSRKGKDQVLVTKGVMRPASIPEADPSWHKIATMFFTSLTTSGQADYYQDSDWALAYSLCEDLSVYKSGGARRSGQMLQTIYSAFERLLVAEGDRRRVRIELHEPEPFQISASVTAIADYQKELGLA